jgi:hypothetical protein
MPELFRFYGLIFFFHSREHLPIHIHVKNADGTAKFEVETITLIENNGLKSKDLRKAEEIIKENRDNIISRWKEYHGE